MASWHQGIVGDGIAGKKAQRHEGTKKAISHQPSALSDLNLRPNFLTLPYPLPSVALRVDERLGGLRLEAWESIIFISVVLRGLRVLVPSVVSVPRW